MNRIVQLVVMFGLGSTTGCGSSLAPSAEAESTAPRSIGTLTSEIAKTWSEPTWSERLAPHSRSAPRIDWTHDPTPSAEPPKVPEYWVGDYGYAENCGGTAEEDNMVVTHALHINADGTAELSGDGPMIMTRIRANAVPSTTGIELRFQEYGWEHLPTAIRANKGELLITLHRQAGTITTEWKSYAPACSTHAGQHFTRGTGGDPLGAAARLARAE